MSRSRRKHSFCGITTATSEKDDKRFFRKRLRRRVRVLLTQGETELFPLLREVGEIWMADKDGKQMFDPERWPHLMRK